jgi:hypothetical protein
MNLQKIRKQISKSVDKFLDFAEDKKKEEWLALIQLILNLVHMGVILGSVEKLTRMHFGVYAKKKYVWNIMWYCF